MKAITSDEMRILEAFAVKLGMPARILMEIAGMKVANIAIHEIKKAKVACVICGSGGNGGDGFVAARYLHNAGLRTDVFLTSSEADISSQDALDNLKILEGLGINAVGLSSGGNLDNLKSSITGSDIVIDAIYGIGFRGEVSNIASSVIDLINKTKIDIKDKRHYSVLSIDVPSGADASTGAVASKCVEADITATFEYPKLGLLKYPASKYAG